jgi:hypothetical protein
MAMIQRGAFPGKAGTSYRIVEDERRGQHAFATKDITSKPLLTQDIASKRSIDFASFSSGKVVTGKTVQLGQEGYGQVLRTQSKFEMMNFVRRVIEDLHLKVVNEDALRETIAACARRKGEQSYDGLVDQLSKEVEKPCGFVMSKNMKKTASGTTAPLTEDGYRSIVELQNTSEMAHFIDRVVKDQGYYVVSRDGMNGFVPFHSCERSSSSLEQLQNDVRGVAANSNGWASVANLAPEPPQHQNGPPRNRTSSFASSSTMVRDWINLSGIGTSAPLTELGYKRVAELNSNVEMGIFTLRAIRHLGLEVVDEDRLHGLIPFYSGERSTQSLARLQDEIKTISQDLCAWIVDKGWQSDGETSGRNAPLTEEGYRMIARKRNPYEMQIFVHRLLHSMKMNVKSKAGLHGFVPYFDCEEGAKSLADMRAELVSVAHSPDSWLTMASGDMAQGDLSNEDEEEEDRYFAAISTSVSLKGEKLRS